MTTPVGWLPSHDEEVFKDAAGSWPVRWVPDPSDPQFLVPVRAMDAGIGYATIIADGVSATFSIFETDVGRFCAAIVSGDDGHYVTGAVWERIDATHLAVTFPITPPAGSKWRLVTGTTTEWWRLD